LFLDTFLLHIGDLFIQAIEPVLLGIELAGVTL
jgi:hypothetical protein